MINVLKLILSDPFSIDQVIEINVICNMTTSALPSCRSFAMRVLIFLKDSTVDSFWVQLYLNVCDVDYIFLGFYLWLRADAVLIFDTAVPLDVDKNFILFSFTLVNHVAFKVGEGELNSFPEETSGWFEDGDCLMEVALTFLKVKFDIAVYSIVS
jgi:hypothetical protein